MTSDSIVFLGCLLAGTFVLGMGVGEKQTMDSHVAVSCPLRSAQGEKHIETNGTTCVYVKTYAREKIRRKS